jgi:hypothetical protein
MKAKKTITRGMRPRKGQRWRHRGRGADVIGGVDQEDT